MLCFCYFSFKAMCFHCKYTFSQIINNFWSLAIHPLSLNVPCGHCISTCNTWHESSQILSNLSQNSQNQTHYTTCCQDLSGSGQVAELARLWSFCVNICASVCVCMFWGLHVSTAAVVKLRKASILRGYEWTFLGLESHLTRGSRLRVIWGFVVRKIGFLLKLYVWSYKT